MVADVLLCLPLSIFIQVIQINYKVSTRQVLQLKGCCVVKSKFLEVEEKLF